MTRSLCFITSAALYGACSLFVIAPTMVEAQVQAPIPPINDRCINATQIVEFDAPIANNTVNASFDGFNQGSCGPRTDRRAVWFAVAGTGNKLTASVCTTNNVITDFGVFNECNSLENCNGWAPQQMEPANCADGEAAVYSWESKQGDNYFVHVRADEVSEFNITIFEERTESSQSTSGVAEKFVTSGLALLGAAACFLGMIIM